MKTNKNKGYFESVKGRYRYSLTIKYALTILFIITFIDIMNLPSNLIGKFGKNNFFVLMVILVIFFVVSMYDKHLFDFKKISVINAYDLILIINIIVIPIYVLIIYLVNSLEFYKLIIAGIWLLIMLLLMRGRARAYKSFLKNENDFTSNVIDLKDLYANSFNINTLKNILLDEKEVNYDLLERHSIIEYLSNVLINCKPNTRFTISLEGKWGVGKTTILKNVSRLLQNYNDIVIVDDFEPWSYGTEESIIENFFACLLKKEEIMVNSFEMKKNIKALIRSITKNVDLNGIFDFGNANKKSLVENKKSINNYLKLCGKKIIVYIDNLDRVEDDKIIFIFKIIANILDFERIIYVLSFDDEKVRRIFDTKLNIDYEYTKKIIQLQIKVPEVNSSVLNNISYTCMINYVSAFKNESVEIQKYQDAVDVMAEQIKDLRDLKRFINSILSKSLLSANSLSKRDKIILEYIKYNNFPLYEKIYNNRQFFISEDTLYDSNQWDSALTTQQFNKLGKEFYEKLFQNPNNKDCIRLLILMFPYVKKYFANQNLKPEEGLGFSDNSSYKDVAKARGISSAKYFELYFTDTENEFSMIGKLLDSFIIDLKIQDEKQLSKDLGGLLNTVPSTMQKEFFELLNLRVDEFDEKSSCKLLDIIFSNIRKVDDSSSFLSLNATSRCNVIIWDLLQKISEEKFDEILKELCYRYDYIDIINNVSYWFESDKYAKNIDGRKEKWNQLENQMVAYIIDKDVNLYSKRYYHPNNAWALYRNLSENSETFKRYIKKRMTREYIFKIIYDILGHSFGRNHHYYIDSNNLKSFFEEEDLKKFMKTVEAKTNDEKIVMGLYTNYLENPNNMEVGGIYIKEELQLNL